MEPWNNDASALVIVNPVSGRGKADRQWPRIREELQAAKLRFEVAFTRERGQGVELARQGIKDGFGLIVAAGGDGSVHDVVNGMMSDPGPARPDACLGVIPCGTGNDLVRILGYPREPLAAARHLARSQHSRVIDLGEVTCTGHDGKRVRQIFVNDANLGLAAEVVERLERAGKVGCGTIPYLTMLVRAAIGHRSQQVALELDGSRREARMSLILVCNGQFTGGGMWVAPGAAPDDGRFDVVATDGLTALEILWHAPSIYRGTHLRLRQVSLHRAATLSVDSPQRFPVVADGEPIGECPAQFRVLPGALRVLV